MSDEQATALIGLLVEIRDELRLVRSTVVIDGEYDKPKDLSKRLYDASSVFEKSRHFDAVWGLPVEEIKGALIAAYGRR